jgi:hypothetical protein
LAEVGVEGEAVSGADGPGGRSGEVDQVAADGLGDAGAGVPAGEMAIAVVDQQDGVAEQPRHTPGVANRRGGVESGADNQDRMLGGGVPGAGVAVGAGARSSWMRAF